MAYVVPKLALNFNDPRVLSGYLTQALPQVGLEEDSSRIVVGQEGGLAFLLFQEGSWRKTDGKKIPWTSQGIDLVRKYFQVLDEYLAIAHQHAFRYDFRMVHVDDKRVISEGTNPRQPFFQTGIGKSRIDSPEQLAQFLQMVKESHGSLNQLYATVQEKSHSLE